MVHLLQNIKTISRRIIIDNNYIQVQKTLELVHKNIQICYNNNKLLIFKEK
jgi:hypothetical protein